MSILKYSIGCIALSAMLLACSKDKKYDIRGDKEVKFFFNNLALGNAPQNSISYNVANRPDATGAIVNISHNFPETIKVPVYATRKVTDEVVVSAQLDNSLIAEYNAANNTAFEAFPEGVLSTSGLTARITKDMDYSTDSITIAVNQSLITSLTGKAYLAPVRLTSVSKPGVGAITSVQGSSVTYIVVNPEMRYIQYNAGAADMTGTIINPRSGWEFSYNPAPIATGSVVDGNNNTFMRWGVSSVQIDLNMNETKNVTGVRIFTASSSTYNPMSYSMATSDDGINYEVIGTPARANITFSSGYSYFAFYKPITARYIRLIIGYTTSTNTNNRRLAEFDVYAN